MLVEVAYALPNEAFLKAFEVDETSTVGAVIELSGVLKRYPEIDLTKQQVGVFGKIVALNDTLREKDRIEIYRPLLADPKEVRKRKAAERAEAKEKQ